MPTTRRAAAGRAVTSTRPMMTVDAAPAATATGSQALPQEGKVDHESWKRAIISNLHKHATNATKDWFENYVKGTTWIGCKLPTVRHCVHEIIPPVKINKVKKKTKQTRTGKDAIKRFSSSDTTESLLSAELLLDTAVSLLQEPPCDAKLAGMLILSECFPANGTFLLSSNSVLDRLETCVFELNLVNDWSSADWLAMKVLRKIVLEAPPEASDEMVQRVLDYTKKNETNLWYRRCGIVPFVQYYNSRQVLPADIGLRLIRACEASLLASPDERFTQTGVAWVLRSMLSLQTATTEERDAAAQMILSHGSLWNKEAKRSLTAKLAKNDPLRTKICNLS